MNCKNMVKNIIAKTFDRGSTMNESFIIDDNGIFVVGEVQITTENESIGILNSINDALDQWNTALNTSGQSREALKYSRTAILINYLKF